MARESDHFGLEFQREFDIVGSSFGGEDKSMTLDDNSQPKERYSVIKTTVDGLDDSEAYKKAVAEYNARTKNNECQKNSVVSPQKAEPAVDMDNMKTSVDGTVDTEDHKKAVEEYKARTENKGIEEVEEDEELKVVDIEAYKKAVEEWKANLLSK